MLHQRQLALTLLADGQSPSVPRRQEPGADDATAVSHFRMAAILRRTARVSAVAPHFSVADERPD